MAKDLEHYKKLRDLKYFGAYELMVGEGKTIEINLTILKAVKETLKTKEGGTGLVLYFTNHKPLVVNSINGSSIALACGSEFHENWIGKTITLYHAKIKAFGVWKDCVRVRDKAPVLVKPDLNPQSPNWESAKKSISAGNFTIEQALTKYSISEENKILLCKK